MKEEKAVLASLRKPNREGQRGGDRYLEALRSRPRVTASLTAPGSRLRRGPTILRVLRALRGSSRPVRFLADMAVRAPNSKIVTGPVHGYTSRMSNPAIPQKSPIVMEIEPGTYWWCSCGLSKGQPFCDGAHKGSGFSPTKVEVTEKRTLAFCGCKHSKNGAMCDGSHAGLQ